MKKALFAATIISAALATPALAQEGQWEASIAGNMTATSTKVGNSTSESTNTFMYFRLGEYVTPETVVYGTMSMFGTSSGGGTTSNVGTTFGFGAKYYMDAAVKSAFVPFVEGELHAVVMTSDSPTTTATTTSGGGMSFGIGGSYFITEAVSADLSFQAFSDSLTTDKSSVSFTQSGVRMLFGMTARY
ncbi:MAG: outer membrane beta-barrel protein [Pseudomonadota bacterium]